MLLPLIVAGVFTATAPPPGEVPPPHRGAPPFCTLAPGSALALLRVEKDTTLRFAPAGVQPMSGSGVGASARDSLLATPDTPMPAARVHLLQLDSATRAMLASEGVTDAQPIAFIRAAPYRADCRTMRWTDTVPFVVPGEVGFVRATLAPREQWIDGTPLLVIPDGWNYPYPRRRGLAYAAPLDATLAPATAMFSLTSLLEMPRPKDAAALIASDSARRTRARAWGRTNAAAAELEPARGIVRRAVLEADWRAAERAPSRLRGTYRVDLAIDDQRSTWYFRTHDRPGYPWRGLDSLQTTAALIASPYSAGYRLVGYAAATPDASFSFEAREMMRALLVWLATDDRPTAPGNDARRVLSGMLEFKLSATQESFWNDLEAFVPRMSARDSLMLARLNHRFERGQKQPQLPLTVRLDEGGGVKADTTFNVGGRTLRVVLQRIDTLTTRRPF